MWYSIKNIDTIDSPALVLFPDRIQENINRMLQLVENKAERLRPHVKTYKIQQVVEMQLQSGIQKFKFATIAEGELLGRAGAKEALMAYQPIGPKIQRLLKLVQTFPDTHYAAVVDNAASAKAIAAVFAEANEKLDVFLDIDAGMHRTGIPPDEAALELFLFCRELEGIRPVGLHVYDGQFRDSDYKLRKAKCDEAFEAVRMLEHSIAAATGMEPKIVAGGSPTFTIHNDRPAVECSPGTCLLWDWGYSQLLPEQDFLHAAVVVSRIISKIGSNQICTDLGHKSIAAEQPFPRVHFLNLPDAKAISQSEEHLVLDVQDNSSLNTGDVLYGIPIHICPTVALYERAFVVENQKVTTSWPVIARDRRITI